MTPRRVASLSLSSLLLICACATNLLVGADTDAGTTAADGADDGGPVGDGVGDGSDERGEDGTSTGGQATEDGGNTTMSVVTGDTDETTSGTAEGSSDSGETQGGDCPAETARQCSAMRGCVWSRDKRACIPGSFCSQLSVSACVAEDDCLWFGPIEGGNCEPGSCPEIDGQESCNDTQTCIWDEGEPGVCQGLQCGELVNDICEAHPECGLAGPEAEPVCVPGECLIDDCIDVEPEPCGESPTCHLLGEGADSTCLPVECVACPELSAAECKAAPECTFDAKEMACVQ